MADPLEEWRKRARDAGLDVASVESVARKYGRLPGQAAPAARAGVAPRPRRGDKAPRPDRASREGVAQSTSGVWDRLRSIAESDLDDDQKRALYETAGVDEERVRKVLEGIESAETPVRGMADLLVEKFGEPQTPEQQERLNWARLEDAAMLPQREKQIEDRINARQAEFNRDEPWWMTTLKVIDKPRAVVVAGFSQLGAQLDGDDETVASWDRFSDQVGDNVSVSELLPEDMPGWARFAVGLGVDIALDPLTYLTGGSAAVAKVTGKGGVKAMQIASRASDKAVDAALAASRAGDDVAFAAARAQADEFAGLAVKLGQVGGYGGLDDTGREVLERAAKSVGVIGEDTTLRGGVYFRLPGTEGVRIPGLSEALTPVSRYTARGFTKVKQSKAWNGTMNRAFGTPRREFLAMTGRASRDEVRQALSAHAAVTVGSLRQAKFIERMQAGRTALLADIQKMGVDGGDLLRYIDAKDAVAADGLTNSVAQRIASEGPGGETSKLVDRVQTWFEDARQQANLLAGEEWLPKVSDNYTFHMLESLNDADEAVDAATRLAGGQGGRQPVSPEQYRSIEPGRVYRGVEIMEASDPRNLERFGAALSPEDQALEILRRQGLVDEADVLFSKDLALTTEVYVNSVAGRLKNRAVAKMLRDDGVAMSADRFARMKFGAAVTDKYAMLRRYRVPAQVAAKRAEAAAAGLRSLSDDFGWVSDGVASALSGASSVDDVRRLVDGLVPATDFYSTRVGVLTSEISDGMARFAREAERAFREGNPAEVFDLAAASISARTAPIIEAVEAATDEMAEMAASLNTVALGGAQAKLSLQKTKILQDRQLLFTDFAEQMANRGFADEVAARVAVDAQLRFYDDLIEVVEAAESRFTEAFEVARRIDGSLKSQATDLVAVQRALLPGSDGIARLSDGRVARFTRTTGSVDGGAFGRVGMRFQVADDLDAADARFLGDTFGSRAEQGGLFEMPYEYVPRTANDPLPPLFHGSSKRIGPNDPDPSGGITNLLGRGFYTTDNPNIARQYASDGLDATIPIGRTRQADLFQFTTSASRPLTFSGRTAGAQLNAELLVTAVRNNLMPLQKTALATDSMFADSLLWNQFVELTQRAAKNGTPSDVYVSTLDRLVRSYAALDPESFAARVVASGNEPVQTLLDGVVNRSALNATERAQMGVWDDFLEGVAPDPDKIARAYRGDLSKRGWDGVLLDDGTTRELVSFAPQQMRAENEASRILLRIMGEQSKVRNRLNGLVGKTEDAASRLGFNPQMLRGTKDEADALLALSRKRVGKLANRKGRGGLNAAEEAELTIRSQAGDAFKLADEADDEWVALKLAADSEYAAQVRQAEAAGLDAAEQAPYSPRIAELKNEARTWRILASADIAEADLMASGVARDFDVVFNGRLAETPGLAERLSEMLTQNMVKLNDFTLAPQQIVDVLAGAARLQQPQEVRKLLRAWDYVTGVFKSYAVMTTGFITRNAVGAAMNNWIGMVNLRSYDEFFRADNIFVKAMKGGATENQALEAVAKKFGPRGKQAYEAWMDMAAGTSGGLAASWAGDVGVAAADAVERSGIRAASRGSGWRSQGLRDNSATRAFFYMNTRAEYRVRGVMAWDEVYRKGGDVKSATERVYQYHFDYSPSGMSRFESGTLRRIIPFYVWTANNVPLQLKSLVTRPKVAASYLKFKQNMEELSEDEGIVHDYFGRLGAVRLPFTNSEGNSMYFMPDLPFRDLGLFNTFKPSLNPIEFGGNLLNMDEIKSSLNPILKVPMETLMADKKFFTGAPFKDGFVSMGALGKIPWLGPALGALGQARRAENGEWLVGEKQLYAVENFMPWIGRVSRLLPTDAAGREKQMSAFLSTFIGLGFRTNTFREQSNQLFRLQDRLDTAIRSQETLGKTFPTTTEIRRQNTEDRQVANLEQYAPETRLLLDIINSGDVEALADLDGFGPDGAAKVAASVAGSGAFTDVRDLVTAKDVNVGGVEKAVESLRQRSQFTLDIGTADAVELEAMPNIGPKTVGKILALRERGGLVSLGSLRQVGLSAKQVEEIRVWIEQEREFQRQLAGVL